MRYNSEPRPGDVGSYDGYNINREFKRTDWKEYSRSQRTSLNITKELIFGIIFFGVSGFVIIGTYAGAFGYGVGGVIHNAANTISIPISQHHCFVIGMIPVVNMIALLIALKIIILKWAVIGLIAAWPSISHFFVDWFHNITTNYPDAINTVNSTISHTLMR